MFDKYYSNLKISAVKNIYWKEVGLLSFVWVAFLAVQIAKVRI